MGNSTTWQSISDYYLNKNKNVKIKIDLFFNNSIFHCPRVVNYSTALRIEQLLNSWKVKTNYEYYFYIINEFFCYKVFNDLGELWILEIVK